MSHESGFSNVLIALDQINIHANQNVVHDLPHVEATKTRACVFAKEVRSQAIKAVGQYVRVSGRRPEIQICIVERSVSCIEVLVREIEVVPKRRIRHCPTLGNTVEGAASR